MKGFKSSIKWLKEESESKSYTELSKITGISLSHISALCNNKSQNPTKETLEKINRAMRGEYANAVKEKTKQSTKDRVEKKPAVVEEDKEISLLISYRKPFVKIESDDCSIDKRIEILSLALAESFKVKNEKRGTECEALSR